MQGLNFETMRQYAKRELGEIPRLRIVRGVCRGAAALYGVDAVITDEKCVLRGDPACVVTVRRP
jgi:hypothetical protein